MGYCDALGWAACLMTLVTFVQQRMLPLRAAAILANVFFIGYAAIGHYLPILALHATLLPINCQRLVSLLSFRTQNEADPLSKKSKTKNTEPEHQTSNFITGLSGLI